MHGRLEDVASRKGNLVEFASELVDARRRRGARRRWRSPARPRTTSTGRTSRPTGAAKFLARAWRVSGEVDLEPRRRLEAAATPRCGASTHRLLADAPGLVEAFKFNVVVARLMELVNATRKAIDTGAGPADPAVREAAEVDRA